MPIKALALDPGVTTGFATGEIDKDGRMKVVVGQAKLDHKALWEILSEFKPDHIIIERFDYRRQRNRDNLEMFPRELIGIVHLWKNLYPQSIIREQIPAQAKGYYTDAKLKEEKVYIPGRPHAMDALRHLLQWYTFGAGYKFNKEGFYMP